MYLWHVGEGGKYLFLANSGSLYAKHSQQLLWRKNPVNRTCCVQSRTSSDHFFVLALKSFEAATRHPRLKVVLHGVIHSLKSVKRKCYKYVHPLTFVFSFLNQAPYSMQIWSQRCISDVIKPAGPGSRSFSGEETKSAYTKEKVLSCSVRVICSSSPDHYVFHLYHFFNQSWAWWIANKNENIKCERPTCSSIFFVKVTVLKLHR